MKSYFFSDIAPWSPVKVIFSAYRLPQTGFLLGLRIFFDPKDGRDRFPQNVG
jgi:hypothetical protein